jgi:hypothetical protein
MFLFQKMAQCDKSIIFEYNMNYQQQIVEVENIELLKPTLVAS